MGTKSVLEATCPRCKAEFRVPELLGAKKIGCHKCGLQFHIELSKRTREPEGESQPPEGRIGLTERKRELVEQTRPPQVRKAVRRVARRRRIYSYSGAPLILVWIFILIGTWATFSEMNQQVGFNESVVLGVGVLWGIIGFPLILLAFVATVLLLDDVRQIYRGSGITPPGYSLVVVSAVLSPIACSAAAIVLTLTLVGDPLSLTPAFVAAVVILGISTAPIRSVITPPAYRLVVAAAVLCILALSACVIYMWVVN